jgi:Ca2+-binding RTX toxin-like protein
MTRSRLIPAASAAALALLATGLAATPATAGGSATTTVGMLRDGTVVYTAGRGQANNVNVFSMGPETGGVRRVGFTDVVPITPGDRCTRLDPNYDTLVVCDLPAGGDRPDDIRIRLGDGDDEVLTTDPGVSAVDGGSGDDELHAHTAELVTGGDGDDMLMGHHVLSGGDGMDHLMGSPMDEVMHGGPGDDMIEGWDGRDVVHGGSGNDDISGGEGNDVLSGGFGDDHLRGDGGRDVLVGGPGRDELTQ